MGDDDMLRTCGHAKDYSRMQCLMFRQDAPEDYVFAIEKQY